MFNHLNQAANALLNHENSTKTDFFLITKEYTIENSTSFYGCFYIGPFETGEGLTISNTLRRTLLTSVGGLAITAVQIEGVSHEYSSLPGLKETVLDILLAMNDVVLTTQKSKLTSKAWSSSSSVVEGARGASHCHRSTPQIGYLKKSGPGIIYAHDLRLPPGICCVNPRHSIGTLSDVGHLNMKFEIQFGRNWKQTTSRLGNHKKMSRKSEQSVKSLLSEEKKVFNNEIILNPVFNPIKKVNYTIESLNDSAIFTTGLFQQIMTGAALRDEGGKEQDCNAATSLYLNKIQTSTTKNQLEIIVLEIWTDGSIHPRDALSIALRKCVTSFSKLAEIPRSFAHF